MHTIEQGGLDSLHQDLVTYHIQVRNNCKKKSPEVTTIHISANNGFAEWRQNSAEHSEIVSMQATMYNDQRLKTHRRFIMVT